MNLEAQIAKIVAAHGAEFYDTEVASEGDHTIYRVFITKPEGVTLDLCAEISNDLSPFLDVHPPVGGKYFLEVSSPGIERKLTKPVHFQNAIGEKVKVKIPGEERIKGVLKSADDKSFVVETKHDEVEIAYDQVGTVKTYFEW